MNKVVLRFPELRKLIARNLMSQGSFLKKFQMYRDCVMKLIVISNFRKMHRSKFSPAGREKTMSCHSNNQQISSLFTGRQAEHFRIFEIAITFVRQSLDI